MVDATDLAFIISLPLAILAIVSRKSLKMPRKGFPR